MNEADSLYWKRKLAAYLHDSPDKVLSIVDHEKRAQRMLGEIFPEEAARKESDWAASAADRLPFPPSSSTKTDLTCFKHPLGGAEVQLNKDALTIDQAEEISQKSRPSLNEADPRAAFIASWRFWRNWASSIHPDFAIYPAETRLPDHTIWNHLAVTSAMQGCLGGEPWKREGDTGVADHPCFLLFTIGPVQEFIAQARSTRDLWSGSYLLSYLIGHTLKRIALDFGPDHVVFPNLCDVPLIDLLLKDDVWDNSSTSQQQSLSEAFNFYGSDAERQRLLTPALPNRFLAVLPTNMAEHKARGPQFASAETYAAHLASDLKAFYSNCIAQSVSECAAKSFGPDFHAKRFETQITRALETHWQLLPWPEDFQEIQRAIQPLPPDDSTLEFAPRGGLQTIKDLCQHGADTRYLTGKDPKSVASGWSALYSLVEWAMDSTKSVRSFDSWAGGQITTGKINSKDSLSGREESVLQVGDHADDLSTKLEKTLGKAKLLKKGENLGAISLVKRLWPYTWLCRQHAFEPQHLAMPNTRSIAAHQPWETNADDEPGESSSENYFAVLALDGDSMGKWISGSKTPSLEETLSAQAARAYREAGANLNNNRPLSPSWHLQFAEALGNFAQHAARRIVEAFDGRLIYAGGDDVLALLPSDTAIACAQALRLAFQGDAALNNAALGIMEGTGTKRHSDQKTPLFQVDAPGFLRLTSDASARHGVGATLLDDPVHFPVVVPGPNADCSVGIAIAHSKSPLQDVVRAAQSAEKRAKQQLRRSAMAVSLFKRSGEITQWGCNWESGGLPLYETIVYCLADESLSSKFPHRVCQLLEPYLTSHSGLKNQADAMTNSEIMEVIEREVAFAAERQGSRATAAEIAAPLKNYLTNILQTAEERRAKHPAAYQVSAQQELLRSVIGLCTTVAFAHRTKPEPSTLASKSN